MKEEIEAALAEVPANLQVYAKRIFAAGQRTFDAALDLGQTFIDARKAAGYGQWLPFLKRVGIPARTAHRYMQLAERIKDLPDADRGKLTTIRAVLEDPGPAPGIDGVSESDEPDGGLQIGHAAGLDTLGDTNPVDFRKFDAMVEQLPPDKIFGGLAQFVQDDRRWKIGGKEYRTHPALAVIPEPDRTIVERIANSIGEIGQIDQVVVDPKTQTLVAGRGRILACELAGVPVKWRELRASESATEMAWRSNTVRRTLRPQEQAQASAQLEDLGSELRGGLRPKRS